MSVLEALCFVAGMAGAVVVATAVGHFIGELLIAIARMRRW